MNNTVGTEQSQVFKVNGVDLTVLMDFDSMKRSLNASEKEWEADRFTIAWTVDDGNVTKEDYMKDIEDTRNLIATFEQDPSILEEYVEQVRTKKNGEFWKNSGLTIKYLENVSSYFTDFTNAWSVLQLRLRVLDAKTCVLQLELKTETN